jgi:hypothetical protein
LRESNLHKFLVALGATVFITQVISESAVAASMDDNLRTATLTILASRNCKGVNDDKVRYVIAGAVNSAAQQGVSGAEFMGEVSLKVADLSSWFKSNKKVCKDFAFLYK